MQFSESDNLNAAKALKGHHEATGDVFATAESLTGGLIGAFITAVPGSSAWFDRGFLTYSNEAKTELLGVKTETLKNHGAVSPETAAEMAEGALSRSKATAAVSVTGIAGPDGGTPSKPVGTVCFGLMRRSAPKALVFRMVFEGDRGQVRLSTVGVALHALTASVDDLLMEGWTWDTGAR